MWVLVVINPDEEDVEVRGPWTAFGEAMGAMEAYPKMAEARGNPTPTLLSVAPIQPMVYFNPN